MPYVLGTTRAEPSSSIIGRLRARTLAAHVALEQRLARFEWLGTRERYAAMLERFYGFHACAEPALFAAAAGIPGLDLDGRRKLPLLTADLRALGRDDDALATLSRVEGLPRLDGLARALGALYVVEGATLGGKLIEREAGLRLGLARDTGTAFFGAYGSDAARRWRSFGAVLEREAELLDAEMICASAVDVFGVLDRWLVV